ncbi:TolC family protein, partial [Candidatus Poribacteria bacterium]|nr:TolC family protein [Candidatus Poribacteria bacterium]
MLVPLKFRPARLVTPLLVATALFSAPGRSHAADMSPDPVMKRMEDLARSGELPRYEDLRLPEAGSVEIREQYIRTIPLLAGDVVTTGSVFSNVPPDSHYAELVLDDLVAIVLEGNFDLVNSRRSVQIARSAATSSQAFFLPFVDLVSSARVEQTRDPDSTSTDRPAKETTRTTTADTEEGGLEMGQELPTGGRLTFDATQSRVGTRDASGDGIFEDDNAFDSRGEVRFIQPLLRGGGTDVGTADLRRSRLREMDSILTDKIAQRDRVLEVIRQYFQILQFKQQLLVSADAIRERYRFLDETRVKYEVGRVAESEILRAEIQFLQEIETAINRQQQLDNARESL